MVESRRAALVGALIGLAFAGVGAGTLAGAEDPPCESGPATLQDSGPVVCSEPVALLADAEPVNVTPAPAPAPAPAEEPAPTPTPAPEPAEAPEPAPSPAPAEAPESAPTPQPAPAEAPEPAPTPQPEPAEESTPTQEPEAAAEPLPNLPPAASDPAPEGAVGSGELAPPTDGSVPAVGEAASTAGPTEIDPVRPEEPTATAAAAEAAPRATARRLAGRPAPAALVASTTRRPAAKAEQIASAVPVARSGDAASGPAAANPLPGEYVAGWDPAALLRTIDPGEAPPVPAYLLPIYVAAGVQHDVPWSVLAAINDVETDFGRNVAVSSAGAVGWMQFMPATWRAYGQDGNGDGVKDPSDPVDAIFAAGAYLQASGAKADLGKAVFAYNHAGWYVRDVLGRAAALEEVEPERFAVALDQGLRQARELRRVGGGTGLLDPDAELNDDRIGRRLLLSDERLAEAVLDDPRISIYRCGRSDIAAGAIDRRVLVLLSALADRDLDPTVSSLRCGHSVNTKSGNLSQHTTGTGVDFSHFAGENVIGNQGRGSRLEAAAKLVLALGGPQGADQVISLMTFPGYPQAIAMGDHADHLHVGFRPLPRVAA